jgi:hypothetical protein
MTQRRLQAGQLAWIAGLIPHVMFALPCPQRNQQAAVQRAAKGDINWK